MKESSKKERPPATPAPSAEDEAEISDLEHVAHSSSETNAKHPRDPDESIEDYLERTGPERFRAMNDRLNKGRGLNKIPGAKQM